MHSYMCTCDTLCLSEVPKNPTCVQTAELIKGVCLQASEDALVKQITLKQDVVQVRSNDYIKRTWRLNLFLMSTVQLLTLAREHEDNIK